VNDIFTIVFRGPAPAQDVLLFVKSLPEAEIITWEDFSKAYEISCKTIEQVSERSE